MKIYNMYKLQFDYVSRVHLLFHNVLDFNNLFDAILDYNVYKL